MKLIPFSTRLEGSLQEAKALRFLEKKGYRRAALNFSSKYGEIDLVLISPDRILVFVEVRYRKNSEFGTPAETVSWTKQSRIRKTAACFLLKHKAYNVLPCRFDVIAITDAADNQQAGIQWIKNAFS